MNKPEHREGLVRTIAQWCGANKTSGSLKRTSDATQRRPKDAQKTNRRRKASCPESAIAPPMASVTVSSLGTGEVTIDRGLSRSSNNVTGDGQGDAASNSVDGFLTVPGLNKYSVATSGSQNVSRSSSPHSTRRNDLDPDRVVQSATSKSPTAPRTRKRGVTFKPTDAVVMPSSLASSRAVSVDFTPPEVTATLAPPSGGRKKLPNGRCRRYSDVMEHRQQVRLRRASCGAVATHSTSFTSAMTPLKFTGLSQSDVTSDDDVLLSGPSPRRRQGSVSGRRSPNSPSRLEDSRDARTSPTTTSSTGRVKQLLCKLNSAPLSALSSCSRRITLQRTKNYDLSYAGDVVCANGGSDGDASGGARGGSGARVRSRSLSSAESPFRRRARGGIVCANRDIIGLQDKFGVIPTRSVKPQVRNRCVSAGEKGNVKCERPTIGGSVVPWQGDDMVVNVNALGMAMEKYLGGGLSSECE